MAVFPVPEKRGEPVRACGLLYFLMLAGVSGVLLHRLDEVWSTLRIPALARIEASVKYARATTTPLVSSPLDRLDTRRLCGHRRLPCRPWDDCPLQRRVTKGRCTIPRSRS